MADIDDELLALAGEASSDEESGVDEPTASSRPRSPSPQHGSSAKTARKFGGRKKRGEDSEEEGEASSEAESMRSAPMDESDSESDASPALNDEGDRYPLEGKFMNSSDRADILAMPEIKREEVLADRAAEVERDRQNRALRQLLNARESEEKKKDKKRKAGNADLDENQRKTSRQRTKLGGGKVGESSNGIDNLKRARAEKNDRQRRRDEDRERNKDHKSYDREDYSDADVDGDGDSEVEWNGNRRDRKSPSPDYRGAEPASLHDIERVRVGRSRFAMVCFYPGFDEAITGCFARISVGFDKTSGQGIYRMALIKGFTEDRPYAMETVNGKQFKTTQYLSAAHGKAEKPWPFINCSDSPFTQLEWDRYKETCAADGVILPTKPKLMNKINDINKLVNRSWTEAELQAKLLKSGALTNKWIPLERSRLTNLLKDAKSQGDEEKAEKVKAELDALDGPKLAYGTSLQSKTKKEAPTGPTQQDRLAELNLLNRRKNAEDVRNAQIAERRASRKTEAALARGESVGEDTSRRIKTRAKFKHDVADSKPPSGESTPVVGTPDLQHKKNAPLPYLTKLQANKGGLPAIRRPLQDDDVISSVDFNIDIEL